MGLQYAVGLPHANTGDPLQGYPTPIRAKATYGTIVALGVSSVITLTDNTTVLEINAFGGNGVAIRWIPSTETAAVSPFASVISSGIGLANFDHIVPAGQQRRFVVPIETAGVQSIVGANVKNGLFKRVAWTAAGATASVMATEF